MAHKKMSVIFMIVLISFTCAQLNETTSTETPFDPTESTTKIPESSSSSTTTTPPSTTPSTTVAPDTTTVAPTTTTVPSTTTVAPVTTTVAPNPTPVPSPDYKIWSYKENNQTCVIVQLAVQLNLTYKNTDDKPINVLYNVPANNTTVLSGSCGKDDQSITVGWGQKSQMMLQFSVNNTAKQFVLAEIYLSINASDVSANAKADQTLQLYHISNDFPTSLAMSYHCNKVQTIGFTNTKESKEITANATISHVQLEAFHTSESSQFSTAQDCEAIDTPDIVPIAVGCALAGLVVVVLIAYLVGRRRAQARGYLSM